MGYCEGRGSWTIEKIFVPLEIGNFIWFSGSPCDNTGNAKPDIMWSLSSCCFASGFISGKIVHTRYKGENFILNCTQ